MKRENQDFRKFYELGKRIGEGFGVIYEGKEKETNEKRAIKVIDKKLIIDSLRKPNFEEPNPELIKPYFNCFYNEIKNMKICEGENGNNKNSVKFYEYFDTKDEFVIVMELCDENMLKFIARRKIGISLEGIKEVLSQLNKTFKIMHENKIIYRDLKLENILIKYENDEKTKFTVKLKLGEGSGLISQLRKIISSTKNKYYCNNFNAPEIFKGNSINEQCDLWSLGVIIFVLFFKNYPYSGVTEDAIKKNIEKDGQKNLNSTKNSTLDDLIHKLLVEDTNKRLTWEEYFNHPFIRADFRNIYKIGKKLGEGGSGTVYKATVKKTGKEVAIKIFDINRIKEQFMQLYFRMPTKGELKPYIDKFYKEMNNMKIVEGKNKDNQNAVKIYEYYETESEFIIVMELCDCNLFNFFIEKKESFKPYEIKEILTQINNTFKIMSEKNLVHRAIKLENILLKFLNKERTKYIAKLKLTEESNFLKDLPEKSESNKSGDFKLMAPEILKNEKYTEKCDLWSLGIIIYVLICRNYPFVSDELSDILAKIDTLKNISIKTNNEYLNDLVSKMLKINPEERITWNDYFNHPFFCCDEIKIRKENYDKYYKKGIRIGSGGYGIVYKAIKKDTDEERAIKIIDKGTIKDYYLKEYLKEMTDEEMEEYINGLSNEIKNMKIVEAKNNENTVKFYECFDTKEEFAIVMELCNGTLANYYATKRENFNINEIKAILIQLNKSFKIMEERRLVHRDLKLDNILIKESSKHKKIFKLSDYGLSKQLLTISKKFSTKLGTLYFTAPEILKGEKYNQECDLWSLGIIIYVLFFRDYPYKGENQLSLLNQITNQGQNLLRYSNNKYFDDLVRKLLTEDQNKRITWKEYFNDPFFITPEKQKKENKIVIKLKIKKDSISKNIYFLSDNFNEINETNIELLYINNKQTNFNKFFKTSEEGEYEIKIIFKNNINNCNYMFNKCNEIISIDLSSFDSSDVTNMSYMFSECNNLENINLYNLNVNNVKDMSYMFNKCDALKKIEFPDSFKTQSLEKMTSMFHLCQNLSEIIFPPSFNTSKVKNMKTLFGKCYSLKKLIIIYFNTEEVTDMGYMFDQCSALEEILINPSIFKTDTVINMAHMFSGCQVLKEINISSFNIKDVKLTSFMFENCEKLEEVDLSNSKINKGANMIHMFEGCTNIKKINISSFEVTEPNKLENIFDNLSKSVKIIVNKNCLQQYKKLFNKIESNFLSN